MTTPRAYHTATLLLNGKVLVAGGTLTYDYTTPYLKATATAELYDPARGTFIPTGSVITARTQHTASLLPDGRVLIAGGYGLDGYGGGPSLNTAEIYDPATGTFRAAGSMIHDECFFQSLLLGNGKVLLLGGSQAELYDPTNGSFADAGPYAYGSGACWAASASRLADGKVLIVRDVDTAEIYDPVTSSFSATDQPAAANQSPTLTLLMDGTVLLAGGSDSSGPSAGSALFDPATLKFIPAARMNISHSAHSATLLPDGSALIASGTVYGYLTTSATDLYEPVGGTFRAGPDMITARFSHSATLLNDGRVLVAGGNTDALTATSLAEVYSPNVLKPAPVLFVAPGADQEQGAILHAGTARIATAADPAVAGEVLEIYATGLNDESVVPPQIAIGGQLAEIWYFGKAFGYVDLNQVNFRVPSGIAPAPNVPVRMIYLGRPSNEVTIGVN
jgi:hypothetical protein